MARSKAQLLRAVDGRAEEQRRAAEEAARLKKRKEERAVAESAAAAKLIEEGVLLRCEAWEHETDNLYPQVVEIKETGVGHVRVDLVSKTAFGNRGPRFRVPWCPDLTITGLSLVSFAGTGGKANLVGYIRSEVDDPDWGACQAYYSRLGQQLEWDGEPEVSASGIWKRACRLVWA